MNENNTDFIVLHTAVVAGRVHAARFISKNKTLRYATGKIILSFKCLSTSSFRVLL